jgi:serine/threonine-protein kinase
MDNQEQTVLASASTPRQQEYRACPFCGTANDVEILQKRSYRCLECQRELAHIDYAPNGDIRSIFGWLLNQGEVILERYQIQQVLGKGGFGAAYLAEDLQLSGKRRALKEIPAPMFDEYETSLLSRLDHPAIPDIIERRAVNGMYYLVLKFGGSRTLGSERKQYQNNRIPQAKLLPWMRQLCEVLIYLHSQNPPIIHRDLKPDNVLLDENERIMLIDFGIAKEAAPETLTRTLGRAATMHFSPPEQVMGTGTDQRADIYALGATFYALLTGQNPPAAHERVAGKELIPPSEIVPDIAPEIEDAILQALSLNMNHRQQTMREFAAALGGVEAGEILPSRPTGPVEPHTVLASRSIPPSQNLSRGLKLPTGRTSGTRPAPVEEIPAPPPRAHWILPAAASVLVTLAILGGGWYWYANSDAGTKPEAAGAGGSAIPTPTQPVGVPAATQPQILPVAPMTPQAPITPQTPAQTAMLPIPTPPAALTPPATSASPPLPSGSAEEILKASRASRQDTAAEPPASVQASTAPDAPASAVSRPPVKKPKPAPRKTTSSASSPASSGHSRPSNEWVIIPGGAHRTGP